MSNNTNNTTANTTNKAAILAALEKAGLKLADVRAAVKNDGQRTAAQTAAAAAVEKKTGLSGLSGLNKAALELLLFAVKGGKDEELAAVTRPEISGATPEETAAKRAAAVRGSSQGWRDLVRHNWKVTISKDGKTYTLPLK